MRDGQPAFVARHVDQRVGENVRRAEHRVGARAQAQQRVRGRRPLRIGELARAHARRVRPFTRKAGCAIAVGRGVGVAAQIGRTAGAAGEQEARGRPPAAKVVAGHAGPAGAQLRASELDHRDAALRAAISEPGRQGRGRQDHAVDTVFQKLFHQVVSSRGGLGRENQRLHPAGRQVPRELAHREAVEGDEIGRDHQPHQAAAF